MTVTTSRNVGFLAPFGTPPLDDDSLDQLLQALICGITGLAKTAVRPRWQPTEPMEPAQDQNWAALGITERSGDMVPAVIHHDDTITISGQTVYGYDELRRYEHLVVTFSFYGPHANSIAALFRDGLFIAQNRESLFLAGVAMKEVEGAVTLPDLINTIWRKRVDVKVHFDRVIVRNYPVENIVSAQGEIEADLGEHTTPWDTTSKR